MKIKIGYRKEGKILKFYAKDGDRVSVYSLILCGNKRVKPERRWKYFCKKWFVNSISSSRFEKIKWGLKWFDWEKN